jgi:very-short-patch-repair endonuclease
VQQLVQLELLCHSANRPDASWLDPIRIQHVQEQLPRIRADYEKYNNTKRRLLECYDKSFFRLEVDRLIEQYRGPYRTIFRWLIPSFYRDKRAIARTHHAGVVPESILEDLLTARELKQLANRLTTEQDNVRNLLAGYYRSYDTNFDLIERALAVAKEAIALAGVIPVPNELVQTISLGTIPPPELRNTGNRLRESLKTWEQEVQGFSRLLWEPKETPGFLQTAEEKLSGRNRLRLANRLQKSPLLEVRRWLCELATPLAALHRLTENVLTTCIGPPPTDYAAILAHLKELEKLKKIESGIAAESERLRQHYGAWYNGIDTNWSSVLAALDWTKQVQQLLGSAAIPDRFIELASQGAAVAPLNVELTQAYEASESLLKSLEGWFDSSRSPQVRSFRQLKLERLNQKLAQLRSRVDDLQAWVDFRTLERRFAEVGLASFLERLQAAPPQASQLVDVFHKAVYQAWVSSIIAEDPALREFRSGHHEQIIEEFREVDRKLVLFSSNRVIEQCNSRRPQHVVPAGDSEIAVLMKEAHKQRRHLPIRQLIEKIPNLLLRLKPCLMMSPISVSQFLNPERLRFDLVIFDEASQICPEDAVGSIYRGTQLIVVGDNKQLPPTTFFQQAMTEEYDWEDLPNEEFAVFDSILDKCSSIGLPVKMLRWHYRSKHESLIAFSNRQFYETRLITFPSIWAKHENLGVKFVHVPDGVYDRGGKRDNRREAKVVADLVFDHFRRYPDKTLGVVAFSVAQMTAIEDEIEERRRSHPEFERFFKDDRLEGFFVKNLENIQGDERDVIIFSVGYGYDQQHRMTMNFGPLNKPGGERRLNVAVTRAREKVILVSSVKAADIDLGATQASGVLQLHKYLEYAERGEVALENTYPPGGGEPESDLEREVANEIQRLGFHVVHQVGCSGYRIDLGVLDPVEPGRFLLGVECDGATYHSAYTARDRDRLRQQVLEELGWRGRIHRVWSPDWTLKRGTEIERLKSAIEKARQLTSQPQGPSQSTPQSSPNPIANPSTVTRRIPITLLQEGNLPGTVLYKIAELHPSTRVEPKFHLPKWRSEQCRLLTRLVRVEGPVHIDYAAKRLVAAWGLKRTDSRIMKTFRETVRHCQREGALVRKGDFLWPPNLDKISIRVPDPNVPESVRKIEHIPPEEIQNAVLLIVKHTIGIKLESLLIQTARLFGFDRTGPNIRSVLIKVYEKMLRDGLISQTNDSIVIGSGNA